MIALSDSELHEVMQAAQMVPWHLRDVFLERVAAELRGKTIGPGMVHRVAYTIAPHHRVGRGAGGKLGALGRPQSIFAGRVPAVAIGRLSVFRSAARANTNVVLRARDARKLAQAKRALEDMLERVQRVQSNRA